ncbi:MAG: hypothetical protein ACI9ZT_001598 [Gammaproteobacteria bacterium]|jgi:hypothetical protein
MENNVLLNKTNFISRIFYLGARLPIFSLLSQYVPAYGTSESGKPSIIVGGNLCYKSLIVLVTRFKINSSTYGVCENYKTDKDKSCKETLRNVIKLLIF